MKSYIPTRLPLSSLEIEPLFPLLREAYSILNRSDEIFSFVKDPEKVFALLTAHEIVCCLQSKKKNMTPIEYLRKKAEGFNPTREERELLRIFCYGPMLRLAKKYKNKQITTEHLCKLHSALKESIKNPKDRGNIRDRQNWIGPEGKKIEEAYYIPPEAEKVIPFMENLDSYITFKEKDPLIQIAIYFAQFLLIHPFMDGNGRVGRALLPVFLYQKKLISSLLFYLSPYFHRHRRSYSRYLYRISTYGDWNGWICFFLRGVVEEGKRTLSAAKKILKAYLTMKEALIDYKGADKVLNLLFAHVVVDPKIWEGDEFACSVIRLLKKKKYLIPYKRKMVSVKPLLTIYRLAKKA